MLRIWANSHLKIKKEQSLLKNVFIAELVNSPVTCQDVIEKTRRDPLLSYVLKYNSVNSPEILSPVWIHFHAKNKK